MQYMITLFQISLDLKLNLTDKILLLLCYFLGTNNLCANHNGGCSQSCHPAPDNKVECTCIEGTDLIIGNDGKMCVPKNHTCSENEFVCQNGRCLRERWVCDLDNDCGDGSDEDPNMCGEYTEFHVLLLVLVQLNLYEDACLSVCPTDFHI